MGFYTADFCDKYGDKVQVLNAGFLSYGGAKKCEGVIETVKLNENNKELADMLQNEGNGRVLVVDVEARYVAVVGENMMKLAQKNHWVGILVNGYVRDIHVTKDFKVGLWALGTCPKKNPDPVPGFVGHTLEFGGVRFESGHYLYADRDGIIVSKKPLSL